MIGYFRLSNLDIINRCYFPFESWLSAKLNNIFFTSLNIKLIHNSSSSLFITMCVELVKFHIPSLALMNLRNGPDKSNNITSKTIAAIPIAGVLVSAALLLGLLSVIGSETVIAQQQNMTGTNATTAANATGITGG
jgi:hypothetical protein